MRQLALFARRPVPGRVKTRLSPAIPAPLACDLHRAMLADALAVLASARADGRALYWDGPGPDVEVTDGIVQRNQRGEDLGRRLAGAFEDLLAAGGPAVVFGTDCPALDRTGIDELFTALAGADLAVRPALDGGYVAIGLARAAPAIFEGIAWGSAEVLERTLERARSAGLVTRVLEPALADLDTPLDLLRHLAHRPGGPALDRALRGMGLLPPS